MLFLDLELNFNPVKEFLTLHGKRICVLIVANSQCWFQHNLFIQSCFTNKMYGFFFASFQHFTLYSIRLEVYSRIPFTKRNCLCGLNEPETLSHRIFLSYFYSNLAADTSLTYPNKNEICYEGEIVPFLFSEQNVSIINRITKLPTAVFVKRRKMA